MFIICSPEISSGARLVRRVKAKMKVGMFSFIGRRKTAEDIYGIPKSHENIVLVVMIISWLTVTKHFYII